MAMGDGIKFVFSYGVVAITLHTFDGFDTSWLLLGQGGALYISPDQHYISCKLAVGRHAWCRYSSVIKDNLYTGKANMDKYLRHV